MSMDAVALVKIPLAQLAGTLTPNLAASGTPDNTFRGPGGTTIRLAALDDATLVVTPVPFATEPDEIALALRTLLGAALDAHDDARGVFVMPDKAAPRTGTYAAAIEDAGELGFWVPRVAAGYVPKRIADAPAGSMEAQLRELMSAIPPEQLAQMESLVGSGDPAAFGAVQQQLAAMFSSPDAMAQLQQAVGSMLAQHGGDPNAMLAEMGLASNDDGTATDLLAQARAQLESLRETDPALYRQLSAQLDAAGEEDAADEDAPKK